MPSRLLLALALFLLLGCCGYWLWFRPPPAASAAVIAPTKRSVSLKQPAIASAANPAVAAASPVAPEATEEAPPYCLRETPTAEAMPTLAQAFHRRHPELGVSPADVELILATTMEVGIVAAESIYEVDTQTQRITASGRFHDQPVEALAELAASDPEAALIYGSHLMHQGLVTDSGHGINLDRLAEGERVLQYALRHGQQRAIHRLYSYHYFASMRAWRKHGRSPTWHAAETARVAYSQWLLRNASAGLALIVDNDYRTGTRESGSGQQMPTGDLHDPSAVARKLADLERTLPTVVQSQEQLQQREHVLWLNRRGLFDVVIDAQMRDCKTK